MDARKVSNISILDEECARMPLKGNEIIIRSLMPEVRQGQIGPAVNRNCEMGISSRAWIDVGATWAEWLCRR